MKILGIKLTHDAAFALVDDGRLVCSYELEKLRNNPRHIDFNLDLREMESVLRSHGYDVGKLDKIVIDGWSDDGWQPDGLNAFANKPYFKELLVDGNKIPVGLTHYGYLLKDEEALAPGFFNLAGTSLGYASYPHTSGHIFSSYCTSPFAAAGQPAYVLIWDGSIVPQLFYFHNGEFHSKGMLFPLVGHSLVFFSRHFPPYDHCGLLDISVAGKIMAYIALGNPNNDLIKSWEHELTSLMELYPEKDIHTGLTFSIAREFVDNAVAIARGSACSSADILCSFHQFLQQSIIQGLEKIMATENSNSSNLCIAGGCALNIKWNSAIRDTGIFQNVWIPPFPNDSGSAIGAACCEMVKQGKYCLEWNVYSGPMIQENAVAAGWGSIPCTLQQLALLLHNSGEPVVFLNGKAELGPRALGNRSILASPANAKMKDILNRVKHREDYRPVAPICLEEEASNVFSPGCADPYMLFEHHVRDEWKNRTPAIRHLDNTARLQTVNALQNPAVYELLKAFYAISGIPLLCNTSANYPGKGFFPDLKSVTEWGQLRFVWCQGTLYYPPKTDTAMLEKWMHVETVICKPESIQ